MAFCMEWDLNLLLNNWIAVQMKRLKKFKASKALFLVLLPGYKKQFLSVVRKGKHILLIGFAISLQTFRVSLFKFSVLCFQFSFSVFCLEKLVY